MKFPENLWKARIEAGRYLFRKTNSQLPTLVRDAGILFVHIPKTAGISLSYALYGREIGHRKLSDYLQVDASYAENLFKFSVVRNPWDRLVSAYSYLKQGGQYSSVSDCIFSRSTLWKYDTFEKMVNKWLSAETVTSYFHFEPQFSYLVGADGEIAVDKVLKFESLSADLSSIQDQMGRRLDLAQKNKSTRKNYKEYYDETMVKKVASVYEQDIELLGYNFD
ncbi:sulfotransferase family 2 domain-containing protein [Microbulbifer pacificus]|uniref:sulfotransferase family 2 domain-containing protein n=1 Tax=Microbulbifer pacificus TaxID=407164 RepID=UPI00131A2D10|nr:sulfotransferase family 2 domain-containing protein [Microbulbifer pacificus]